MEIEERKIAEGRGLSQENQFVLKAYDLLFEPERLIKEKKLYGSGDKEFNKDTLYRLLRVACHLISKEQSVDQFIEGLPYSNKVKKLIAESWEALYEVEFLFRDQWYKSDKGRKRKGRDYLEKGKTILKVPQMGIYYDQILNHYRLLRMDTKPQYGKKKTPQGIHKNCEEFIRHLKEIHEKGFVSNEKYPDGEFYSVKRFDCLAVLVAKIREVITELTEIEKNDLQNVRRVESDAPLAGEDKREKSKMYFSIDEYVKKVVWKRRDVHSVGFPSLPVLKGQGTSRSS